MIAAGSLILLVVVIVLGIVTKKNVGIIGLLAAYIYGTFVTGLEAAEIYSDGFPTTVFFLIMASTFLFGIANNNGTTEVLAKNVSVLARGNNKIIPWLFAIAVGILAGTGGSMLILIVVLPIAYSVCVRRNLNVTMTALIVMAGGMIGGLSPLTLNGIVANSISIENGVDNYMPMWAAYSASILIMAVAVYIIFGGWKIKSAPEDTKFVRFNKAQTITVIAIILVCVGVIFFGQNVGLICFGLAALLVLFGLCDQGKAIDSIPWSTLVLITGMNMLITVVDKSGGIQLLTDSLSGFLTPGIAQPVMMVLSGMLGAVSSSTGVVMPMLIPLSVDLATANPELSALSLIIGVVVGSNSIVMSPFCTVGALALGCAPKDVNVDKLYRQFLIATVAVVAMSFALSFIGFYDLFI